MTLDDLLAAVIPQDWRLCSVDASIPGAYRVGLEHRRFIVYASGSGRTLGAALAAACGATVGRVSEAVGAVEGGDVVGLLRPAAG